MNRVPAYEIGGPYDPPPPAAVAIGIVVVLAILVAAWINTLGGFESSLPETSRPPERINKW